MIFSFLRWDHSNDWYVTPFKMQKKITVGERIVNLSIKTEDFDYMVGHVIDGMNLIPATGYLIMVWETIGMLHAEMYTEISVVFEDVNFMRATYIPKEGEIQLTVMIQKGYFVVSIHKIYVLS